MAYKAPYLVYKPSHMTAAACLLTLNIFASKACVDIGIARNPITNIVRQKAEAVRITGADHPLVMWTPDIGALCKIPVTEIEEIYTSLLSQLDVKQFKGKLANHRDLWIGQ